MYNKLSNTFHIDMHIDIISESRQHTVYLQVHTSTSTPICLCLCKCTYIRLVVGSCYTTTPTHATSAAAGS
jgi:hypothetical protein